MRTNLVPHLTVQRRDVGRLARLEQNHDNRAQKGFVQGIDFLRKSILCGFGLGYIYRDFAVRVQVYIDPENALAIL